jgi:signal transduction histidine kinase
VRGQGSGLGLAGMHERMAAVGGTVRAGPRPGGGWSVELQVPVAGESVDEPAT